MPADPVKQDFAFPGPEPAGEHLAIAAIGAGLASSLGVWDLAPAEAVERLAGQALGA